MAIRQLINLTRRTRKPVYSFTSLRSLSTAVAAAPDSAVSLPHPPPPTAMTYDRLAESVKQKLEKLEDPDPRFLRYNSPHPILDSHTDILSAPLTRVTTLPNGLRIATESNLASATATVGVFIDAGSRFESEETNGTAHFLEHMIFKGTERRNARELEEEIENMGGHLNAYTSRSRRHTTRRLKDKQEKLYSIIYMPLLSSIRLWVVVASGAVKHEDFVEEVKKLFTKLSSDPTTASELVAKEPAIFTGSEGFLDRSRFHRFDGYAVDVGFLESKCNCSELAQRVGINEIAESMMAFNTNYKDTGLFGVYAVAKPDCLDDLAYAIMYEMTKLCYRVSEADVIRARNQLKSSLLLHIDGTSPVAEDIGRQMLTYGRRIPYAELFARIDAVDASTVKRVANRFIFDRDVAISAVGPIQGLPDYNWFKRRTYWLRY
ncbi:hypothetical protein DH2020_037632 [Rehmannia glutinosa]|uniref:Uncharacterized protein n=1 Tax=Rehmannia glutinosa TaxID=99300 RepID=A0ABR0V0X1_REHGL